MLIVLLNSCNNDSKNDTIYTIKTFSVDSSGWGYDIYKDNKMIIHQPNIPAINSDQSFKTKNDAQKTGEFVIKKLENNIFPPKLTKEEVDSLIN